MPRAATRPSSPSTLIFASNRGPVEYHVTENGTLAARRGNGGVVTALSAAAAGAASAIPVTWVSTAMTEGDRLAAEATGVCSPPIHGGALESRFICCGPEAYNLYYNVYCNPVLWFLHHGLWDQLPPERSSDQLRLAWRRGYVPMNERFAGAIAAAADGHERPVVMLQDYQLYLAGHFVRVRLPRARIAHFVHIPWPEPQQWQLVPSEHRDAIFTSMCATDLVGFQMRRDALHFLAGCEAFLPEAHVDYENGRVLWRGRTTYARQYPISIDVTGLGRRASEARIRELVARLRPHCGAQTVVRVDRLDPSKNIVRGFEALQLLLAGRPDLHGRLRFLAFLVPSRTDIPEYRRYRDQAMAAAHAVNARFGRDGWNPVEIFYEDDYEQAIAAMTLYDVLLVNPVADGMNLVAKEGPTVNERNGVLVLSERAGAFEQLKAGALAVSPLDVTATARALADALAMSQDERARRHGLLRRAIAHYDVSDWLAQQLDDLARLADSATAEPTVRDEQQRHLSGVPALVA